jgi:FAD/FMN-containing dehydrogenase
VGSPPTSHVASYYAVQQSELTPACTFTPSTPQELSAGLQIIKDYGCHFAVRSGGHGTPGGWSSSDGGVNINLGIFNEIELLEEEDDGITRVGAGARWGDVLGKLLPLNVSVVGGRSADVGVGGFILGGEFSNLSHQHYR